MRHREDSAVKYGYTVLGGVDYDNHLQTFAGVLAAIGALGGAGGNRLSG